MEAKEIFELIVEADEKLKYAKPGVQDVRVDQARVLLKRARDEAAAIGSEPLVQQADTRLADIDRLLGG